MEFENLGKVWREEETGELVRTRVERLSELRRQTTQAEKKARNRIRRATVLGIVLVPGLAFIAILMMVTGNLRTGIGFAVMAIGCTAPMIYLRRAGNTAVDPMLPVRAVLEKEVERLRALRRSILAITGWVTGALVLGGPLLVLGVSSSPIKIFLWSAILILVGIRGPVAWQRYATQLQAARKQLERWIADLESI